jgi:general secretion pathway protein A
MLYEKFYHLKLNPFSLTADPQFVCMTSQHREALSGLVYGVCTRPGLTLLIGEVGTGKTTLLCTLLKFLEKKNYVSGFCNNPILSREEFYDYLLKELEVPCESPLKSRQLIALQDTLLRNRSAGRPTVLIVDEAQKLSVDLLEEIRLLTNLETPKEKLMHIIMAGQPELADVMRRPELRQLKQRVNHICKLQALSLPEVREYVDHRLAVAGLPNQTVFSPACVQQIHELTGGIPRLMNSLCDSALRNGFAMQAPHITIAIIREAAADLDLRGGSPRSSSANEETRGEARQEIRQGTREDSSPVAMLSGAAPQEGLAEPRPVLLLGADPEDKGTQSARMPLEGYSTRQKSLGFLAGLLDRWK